MRSLLPLLFLLAACSNKKSLFKPVSADKSNISFSNTIEENEQINMLTHEYLYNGGGVGIGDFNNDQLPDIYFASCFGSNKMYLNKGKLQFQDITDEAGVTGEKRWSRGISIIDINNDGLSDIYVCATTWQNPEERRNLLYVNQGVDQASGIPHFAEMAKDYGLDDTASTHMAAFFDYDNDGDLDVYLLVNRLGQEIPNTFRPQKINGEAANTDRLYRCDYDPVSMHNKYTNVSKEAGITWEGFGLGVNILDINKDGYKDVYVSNDYLSGNILYINNRNGTFTNRVQEYFSHGSLNAMGNDAGDINNDGLIDIVETDMAAEDNYRSKKMMHPIDYNWYEYSKQYGIQYQVVRNTLQLNQGPRITPGDSTGSTWFTETGLYSGIAYTDWSWGPLLLDADQDGFKDLMIANGLPKDITDLDFMAYREQNAQQSVTELLLQLKEVKISNYIFKNTGDGRFTDQTKEWGWDFPSFSSGMAYADFDADGDMDVVVNNTNMPATLLENTLNEEKEKPHHFLNIRYRGDTSNFNGIGSMADIYYKGGHQTAEFTPYRGYASSMQPITHFGLGAVTKIDSVVITWQGGGQELFTDVPVDQTLLVSRSVNPRPFQWERTGTSVNGFFANSNAAAGIYYANFPTGTVDFNIQKGIPRQFSQLAAPIDTGDVNNDGLTDLVVGGNPAQNRFIYFQQANGSFAAKLFNSDASAQTGIDAAIELFDADKDGDLDIYTGTGGFGQPSGDSSYADHLFLNNGKGFFVEALAAIPSITDPKSCVRAADIDKDGDQDLLLGIRVIPGSYPQSPGGRILLNESVGDKILFKEDFQKHDPQLRSIGMITDANWTDIDGDKDSDLLLCGEWMGIEIFLNQNGVLQRQQTDLANEKGWWNTLHTADLDKDGDMDLVAGNYGLNGFFHSTKDIPLEIYAGDYDKNGQRDILLSQARADKPHGNFIAYPALTRDMVAEGLPAIKKHFNSYDLFAKATTVDILGKLNRAEEIHLTANRLESVWIENKGGLKFVVHALPAQVQWSAIHGITNIDINEDGLQDLILNGNDYSILPMAGRLDGMNGMVLLGKPDHSFEYLPNYRSGLWLPGNGRSIVPIRYKNNWAVVASQQGGGMMFWKKKM